MRPAARPTGTGAMDNFSDLQIARLLDIGVVVLLLISAVLAYVRGLVHEVLAVAAWVGAIFATIYGFPTLKPFARQWVDIEIVADFGAGIVLFVVALVFLSLLTRRIAKTVKASALNAVDRSLGFLFGLLRGALIIVIAYIGMGMVYPEDERPEWVNKARSLQLIEPGAVMLLALIPENFDFGGGGKEDGSKPPADKEKKPQNKRKVVLELISPKPKGTNGDDVVGYGEKERQQMERLHETIKER